MKVSGPLIAILITHALTGYASAADAEYVAMGSSFAAGPSVGSPVQDSPAVCRRSAYNYPHLLAQIRHLMLTDVTCSGATAVHVLRGRQQSLGPQIDVLAADTKLVTLTVGGNDVSYLGNLFAWSCQHDPERITPMWRTRICTPTPQEKVDEGFRTVGDSLRAIAEIVHQRSPHARLVFIDYTTIVPESSNCPDRLPLSEAELDRARAVAKRLAGVTAEVARQNGALLVRASELTRDHDVCASDPWVSGWIMPPSLADFGPLAYHPTEQAMRAIAQAIDNALGP
jgi:lysophospholipase L1-like esterase